MASKKMCIDGYVIDIDRKPGIKAVLYTTVVKLGATIKFEGEFKSMEASEKEARKQIKILQR